MKLYFLLTLLLMHQSSMLYDFQTDSNSADWLVVDDGVMGGRSEGNFTLNSDGHGVFSGEVSLENNGGFTSVRHTLRTKGVSEYSKFVIHVKGDGRSFQFRAKRSTEDYVSYVYEFETNKDWMTIEIPFEDMYPSFRGRRLPQSNFEGDILSEITFLIANKKAEKFQLLIDKIELR